jgi:hypothetical protein
MVEVGIPLGWIGGAKGEADSYRESEGLGGFEPEVEAGVGRTNRRSFDYLSGLLRMTALVVESGLVGGGHIQSPP